MKLDPSTLSVRTASEVEANSARSAEESFYRSVSQDSSIGSTESGRTKPMFAIGSNADGDSRGMITETLVIGGVGDLRLFSKEWNLPKDSKLSNKEAKDKEVESNE